MALEPIELGTGPVVWRSGTSSSRRGKRAGEPTPMSVICCRAPRHGLPCRLCCFHGPPVRRLCRGRIHQRNGRPPIQLVVVHAAAKGMLGTHKRTRLRWLRRLITRAIRFSVPYHIRDYSHALHDAYGGNVLRSARSRAGCCRCRWHAQG